MASNQPSVVTRHQRLDSAIALAESNANPSDDDNDKLLKLYLEQRTLRAAIQTLMEKETVGGPATVSFTHRVLQSAEEILVVGRGLEVAHVVVDAFGPAGRGNGVASFAISKVSRTMPAFASVYSCERHAVDSRSPTVQLVHRQGCSKQDRKRTGVSIVAATSAITFALGAIMNRGFI